MTAPKLDQYSNDFRGGVGAALESQGERTVESLPSVSECAVHLGLLDAIVRLEGEVNSWGKEQGLADGTAWNLYCHAAAQRFLVWSQAAKADDGSIPPLDILMVWHAYMLNTAPYRRYLRGVTKSAIPYKGIDWAAVHQRIGEGGRFHMSETDTAAVNQLALPADLLDALKKGDPWIGAINHASVVKFDIVGAVQRQLRFAHKMHTANWLCSRFTGEILEAAIHRYAMFFTLMAEHPGKPLSPTSDIDLVWHTHQLSPARYTVFSAMKANGTLINHNDAADRHSLNVAFDATKAIFAERFGHTYELCFCDSCIVSRAGHGKSAGNIVDEKCSGCNMRNDSDCDSCSSCSTGRCSGADCSSTSCSGVDCSTCSSDVVNVR